MSARSFCAVALSAAPAAAFLADIFAALAAALAAASLAAAASASTSAQRAATALRALRMRTNACIARVTTAAAGPYTACSFAPSPRSTAALLSRKPAISLANSASSRDSACFLAAAAAASFFEAAIAILSAATSRLAARPRHPCWMVAAAA